MTSQGYCLCFEVVSPLNSVMFETLDLKYQAKQLSNILTGNTVSALSQNLTASEIKSKQLKHVKRSSIFRERRNQCSPCFEIPELFGANLSILLELIANSSPVFIWTLARSLQWHFRMAPVDGGGSSQSPVAVPHSDPPALQGSLHQSAAEHSGPAGRTGQCQEGRGLYERFLLCLVLRNASKDLT